ncbi:MAG: pyridoxamine 5'-phosphate oxidase family protein [Burkholderiaceae bacterium]|nr:pyridoxamine 5'-phosphate oxidase family protein [Burkholderiaceae bacterium]
MGARFPMLREDHVEFIRRQPMFFVATAPNDGRVNVSPKGLDALRIVDASTVLWLNLTGSGNETAAHVRENGRMTLMFCAFEGKPLIMRLFGRAEAIHPGDAQWPALAGEFGAPLGARQVFRLRIDTVQTSCGFGVPLMQFEAQRDLLPKWTEQRGERGVVDYWREHNAASIDGLDTGISSALHQSLG